MNLKKITAFVRCDQLEKVVKALQEGGVRGMSISKVKGYGEYADYSAADWMTERERIEILCSQENSGAIADIIMEAAHVGVDGDGIIAITPVDRLYRIRTKAEWVG